MRRAYAVCAESSTGVREGAPREGRYYAVAFLIVAALIGPYLAFHIPPGHMPDEANHVARADSLLYGQVIGHRELVQGKLTEGVFADEALQRVIAPPVNPALAQAQPLSPVQKWLATQVPWNTKPVFIDGGSVAGYMPLPYIPQALAIGLCRVAGFSPLLAFRAARMANLYCFLLLGGAALFWTTRGAALIFCTLMVPMTLSLAASCSQDGLLIAAAALAVACLTRAAETAAPLRSKWYFTAAGLLALVAAAKPPYVPLAGLLLLPLRFSAPVMRRQSMAVALAVLPALIWAAIEAHYAALPPLREAAEAGPLWPGSRPAVFSGPDVAAQMRVILAHPFLALKMPLVDMYGGSGHLLREAIGKLDYLCLALPAWLYTAWTVALASALAADICGRTPASRLRVPDFVYANLCVLLGGTAIGLALYLEWTPVGMPWIGGIQGRYLLPLVPVFALSLPRFSLRWTGVFHIVPVCVAAASALALPGILAAFYPLR
jgi:hypothetical protein